MRGLSLVVASGGHSSSQCAGLSLSWPLLLRSTGSRRAGSVIVAHGPSRSTACGIFPDQGSNPCPLHWQADSQPLHHQGSPYLTAFELEHHFFPLPLDPNWNISSSWVSSLPAFGLELNFWLTWVFLFYLSVYLSTYLTTYLPTYLSPIGSVSPDNPD